MLLNEQIRKSLDRDGAAVIPFLSDDELSEVRAFFNDITQQYTLHYTHGMHMTLWHDDSEFKIRIKDELQRLLQPAYTRIFAETRRLNNIFMVKQAHTTGEFAMHLDWSIVDENKYTSINVWIPLQDTTLENGALWVIKGSHKLNIPIRGGGALLPDFNEVADILKGYRTFLPARAGDAILFFHKTIHGSSPNISDADRVVATFSVIPQEAPLRICFQKDADSPLEVYEPTDDFNYKYNNLLEETNTSGPSNQAKEIHEPYQNAKISIDDILPLINR